MPLALGAFSIDIDPSSALVGDTVTFFGQCDEAPEVLMQLTRGPNTVWLDQVDVIAAEFLVTYSPLVDGDYTLYASCGSSEVATFCVGSGCPPVDVGGSPDDSGSPAGPSSSSSSSGGGGGFCRSEWSCTSWSYCSADLMQERTCTDTKHCNIPTSVPNITQSCDACSQSWICSEWSTCSNGQNTRSCVDEHFCGQTTLKPSLTKSCSALDATGPRPAAIAPPSQIPPPGGSGLQTNTQVGTAPTYAGTSSFTNTLSSYWRNYTFLIVGIPIAILLIVILTIFILHHIHKHKPAVNQDQLHTYIKEEKQAGMADEAIRKNLESSGWNDKEISNALNEKPTFAKSLAAV